ncbi:MAG: hypothetical protein U0Y82_04190 [Thermoleophilia bacterium]
MPPATLRMGLRYSAGNRRLMAPMGMGPRRSEIRVDPDRLTVRMGWAFSASVPRSAVTGAQSGVRLPFLGWGVHGWGGRWLVNGSSRGLVRIGFAPVQRARVCGWPVKLHELWVSAEDPDALTRALGMPRG